MILDDKLGKQGGDRRHLPSAQYIDLSTCVNRYGPPQAVMDTLQAITREEIRIHPYEAAEKLVAAHSYHLDVLPSELVAGRGTTEFIWSIGRLAENQRVLVPLPAYTDFLRAFPSAVRSSESSTDDVSSFDSLSACMPKADWVVISNPNNPLGTIFSRAQLTDLCQHFPQTMLIVDESYLDFILDRKPVSMIGCDLENVVVLQSPSKFYGIAGARAGVAWSRNTNMLSSLSGQQDTWPLSALDVAAAVSALRQEEWSSTMRQTLVDDAIWLEQLLLSLFEPSLGHVVTPVPVHYRFIQTDLAAVIAKSLQGHDILVRVLAEGHGVKGGGLRITSPLRDERERFASALKEAFACHFPNDTNN
ncbi:MAG: aminotransferase class I/II-fold pyridoxal phosphate-dependent enzyme [Candidatus Melainabacteria bacterium]|nr:aminotransferase class I/II-fold pyridoxal phosphate-dependent enzyme [Candidatus Melainabacteria bacterium]